MTRIEKLVECKPCGGTGIYVGMAERDGAAVICKACNGTGAYEYVIEYTEFKGRNTRDDVKRVYLDSYGYVIAPDKLGFGDIGTIDMDKEGVSYQEFLNGKMPEHIESLACPMLADQGACHEIKGFTDKCTELNGGWFGYIPDCKYKRNMHKCWERFKQG